MGGPGSGKGTQCERLVERFGLVHLSAGELLREEVRSGSELGLEISKVINQGQIVKSDTTVRLLTNAMAGRAGPFLIDGFPRSISNLEAFESAVGSPAFMLFLDVSEAEMEAPSTSVAAQVSDSVVTSSGSERPTIERLPGGRMAVGLARKRAR
jgi:adenylate kinase family enzyme